MNLNEKSFHYKILSLVNRYNFGIGCVSKRDYLKISEKN
jgi:hypothetical protein